jgi:hypothetical protein
MPTSTHAQGARSPTLRAGRASRIAGAAALAGALALGSCGDGSTEEPVLSGTEYLESVRRSCLATKPAAPTNAVPAVQLRRSAEAASTLQRDFARLRPPPRYADAHREAARLGAAQERMIRATLRQLQRGDATGAIADLNARNRRLLRRANRIAEGLGVRECVRDLGGS